MTKSKFLFSLCVVSAVALFSGCSTSEEDKVGVTSADELTSEDVIAVSKELNLQEELEQNEGVDVASLEELAGIENIKESTDEVSSESEARWYYKLNLNIYNYGGSVLFKTTGFSDKNIQIFLDTDLNKNTGYRFGTRWFKGGAEYLISNGAVFKYVGKGNRDWKWKWVKRVQKKRRYYNSPYYLVVHNTLIGGLPYHVEFMAQARMLHKSGNRWVVTNSFIKTFPNTPYKLYADDYQSGGGAMLGLILD